MNSQFLLTMFGTLGKSFWLTSGTAPRDHSISDDEIRIVLHRVPVEPKGETNKPTKKKTEQLDTGHT